MTEVTGPGAFASASSVSTKPYQNVAEQVERLSANKERTVAQLVEQQATISSRRAEALTQKAEAAQQRVENRESLNGLGSKLDLTV